MNHKYTTTIQTTQVKEVHNRNHIKTIRNIKIHTIQHYQYGSAVSPCGEQKEESHSMYVYMHMPLHNKYMLCTKYNIVIYM